MLCTCISLRCHSLAALGSAKVLCYHRAPTREEDYTECFRALELSPDCDQNQLRTTYLQLAKRFHPDSGSSEANELKFHKIDEAYRKLQAKFSRERWDAREAEGEYGLYYQEKRGHETEEEDKYDIKHTVPQHRQYLSYEGVGYGTPSQRQHQYQKVRAVRAAENVYQHRLKTLGANYEDRLLTLDRKQSQKVKTRYGVDRLVEDLIQEAMSRGEFDNLSGSGQPLDKVRATQLNPYVDFTTHRLNQMLIDSGFVPEWVQLEKDIRNDMRDIKEKLCRERKRLGPLPLSDSEQSSWDKVLTALEGEEVKNVNAKIANFNLVVPSLRQQRTLFRLRCEADRVLREGQSWQEEEESSERERHVPRQGEGLFGLIASLVKGS